MKISVIIPTYTGVEHIQQTLESIAAQTVKPDEVVIIIDGPSDHLMQSVESAASAALGRQQKIKLLIHQNKTNTGRFKARLTGAQLASNDQLLFMDDRVEAKKNYIAAAKKSKERVVVPDIVEKLENSSLIEYTNSLIRHKLFDKYAGSSYKITPDTFDILPKGTSGLWTPKQWFLDACEDVTRTEKVDADTSDDTKLLRALVNQHSHIHHEAKAVAYYIPRQKLLNSIRHLYERGPKFVDYYLKPGRRYFLPIVFFYIAAVLLIISLVFYPLILAVLVLVSIIADLWLIERVNDFFKVWAGLWLVGITFGAGLFWGLLKKLTPF